MSDPLITLTTDFGTASPYVAAMKGVILSLCPTARIIDLSHDIPPQNLRHTAFFLAESVPYFPPSALHVVVVDPGVGSARAILHVTVAGHHLLVPDNGCWCLLFQMTADPPQVIRVIERRFQRPTVSATFHGRDIFAPVAAHLGLGIAPTNLGPPAADWVRLAWPQPTVTPNTALGEVVFVDHFGNLISNVPAAALPDAAHPLRVRVGPGAEVTHRVRTYADAQPGTLVALVSSSGLLEVAVVQGNAALRLNAGVGASIMAHW